MDKNDSLINEVNFLRRLIGLLPGHIYWKDVNFVYQGCNLLQANSAGFSSPDQIIGKTDFDMPWKEQAPILRGIDEKVLTTGQPVIAEEPSKLSHGEIVMVLSKKVPLKDENGKVVGILGISIDITERKQLEQKLAKASQEKTEFIATLNNTVRSQITTIAMMADMLRESGLNEEQMRYLDLLEEANNSVPEDLTYAGDYAKLDSGDIFLYWESLRLLYSIDALQDRYYLRARQRGIAFIIDYTGLSDIWIKSAIVQLKEVLHTILDNVFQYIQKGYIKLSFYVEKGQQGKQEAVICIEDTSPGFESDYLKYIFSDKGLAVDKEVDYPMMSMRFAFCRKMMEALQGRIWADSSPEAGAKFYLAFPVASPNPNERFPDKADYESVNLHRFIIVGDNNASINSLMSFFEADAVQRVNAKKAVADIKQLIKQSADIDMVLIDQSIAQSQIDTVTKLLDILDARYSLLVVLCDHSPDHVLTKVISEHTHITTLDKPLKWMRFYRSLLQVWRNFHRRTLSVLSVEDNPIAQKALKFVLESLDCKVTTVGSGEEAIHELTPAPDADVINGFDVIFLDIGLPGKSGIAVAKEIKQKFQGNCPPLIALTGLTRHVDIDVLYESGLFKAVLEKPVTARLIEDTLAYLFEPVDSEEFDA